MSQRFESTNEIVTIEARHLKIHPSAQRKLVASNLKRLIAKFDLDLVGVLHGVRYEIGGQSGVWIVDGQTRLMALLKLGLGEWPVHVLLHTEARTDARSSQLFLGLQTRSSVNSFAKFTNACIAEDPIALTVLHAVTARGWVLSEQAGEGTISCTATLMRLCAVDDGASLIAALDTILAAWGHNSAACEGKIIEGLGAVYKTYNGLVERDVLTTKLAKYPGGAAGLLGDARGIREYRKGTLSHCVAEQIVNTYNAGRRTRKLDPL